MQPAEKYRRRAERAERAAERSRGSPPQGHERERWRCCCGCCDDGQGAKLAGLWVDRSERTNLKGDLDSLSDAEGQVALYLCF
jgi:hypothetical protein